MIASLFGLQPKRRNNHAAMWGGCANLITRFLSFSAYIASAGGFQSRTPGKFFAIAHKHGLNDLPPVPRPGPPSPVLFSKITYQGFISVDRFKVTQEPGGEPRRFPCSHALPPSKRDDINKCVF